MRHFAASDFWSCYDKLPKEIQVLADKSFVLLKENPSHPSLHFKKVGVYWSARVGRHYRAVAVERKLGYLWFWIGLHDEYERLIRQGGD